MRGSVAEAAALLAVTAIFASPPAGAGEELLLDKAYIREDAVWSGTVTLHGQNVVRRGSTLTILPGTTVRFAWSDEDGNDIGDGELTVEGRLVARGSREQPILFTSARPDPRPKDWTYLQISTSRDSVVENAIFEHAFTGLQVHYSTAEIRDNLFRNNHEGMRFSTTDILIEHNDFVGNAYGIRCEANGSRTTVRLNRFLDNGSAFFPVRKTWDSVKIHDNDILGSTSYNVKLGQTQAEDLDFSNNWWGTADPSAIEASLFDRTKEPTLGRVKYVPFLTAPVPGAGRR